MTEVLEEKGCYLSDFVRFEKDSARGAPPALQRLRAAAIERFGELGFPTARDEEWRFTSLKPITQVPFRLAGAAEATLPDELAFEAHRLVFVNGRFNTGLSDVRSLPRGLVLASLAHVLRDDSKAVERHLANYADYREHPFIALNTAFLQDGAFVSIPKGVVVERPIHFVFLSTAENESAVSHPRSLVLAGEASQARIVESYAGAAGVYFTNAVTEIAVGQSAVIDHYKLQREDGEAFHVATLQVQQARASNFSSHFLSFGGSLVRNEVNAMLADEGCECTLNGLYFASGRQHVDNHTVIDHAKPHCASHELYKGILDGRGHGVFNGKIFVRQDAQKTDAKQTNQTLLLSDDATINTKPQLEIYADDVKCTHGATVGQLSADAIFYLRSRGIGEAEARSLLTFAFANDIVGRIKIDALRERLEGYLLEAQHLPGRREVEEAV